MVKIVIVCALAIVLNAHCVMGQSLDYPATIKNIANDIEKLKADYPQLADFEPSSVVNIEKLSISYGYHTHRPERRGGWTSGVPNPDNDGVWFYIDFHDPESQAQIHTQPVIGPACLGKKKLMFLILEGKDAKTLAPGIHTILKRHGVEFYKDFSKKCG